MTVFTHSLAIVIGIDAYGRGIPPLTTAVDDAARLTELLRLRLTVGELEQSPFPR